MYKREGLYCDEDFYNGQDIYDGVKHDDVMPKRKIDRKTVQTAVENYLKNGGKIKKITEKDVRDRPYEEIIKNMPGAWEKTDF